MAYGRRPAGWFTGFMGAAGRLFGRGMRGGGTSMRPNISIPRHRLGEASGYPKGQKPSWAGSNTPPPLSSIPGYKPPPQKPMWKGGMSGKQAIATAGAAVGAGTLTYGMYKHFTEGGGGKGYGPQPRPGAGGGSNDPKWGYGPQPRPGTKYTDPNDPTLLSPKQPDGSGTGPGKKPMAPVGPKKRSGKGKMKKAPARKGGGRGGRKAPARSGGGGMRKTTSQPAQPKSWWGSMSRGRQNTLIAGAGFAGGFLAGRLSKRRAKGGTVYSGSYVRNYYY